MDPIALQKREKRGAHQRQSTSDAKDYVRGLNEALVCDACDLGGPPPPTVGRHWMKQLQGRATSDSEDDDDQWFWIRCSDCEGDDYHSTCVDPTLISTDSRDFTCESCIENFSL